MSERVPEDQIEELVGAKRHPTLHLGRLDSQRLRVYVLHPHSCLERHEDLRECWYSYALDKGIDPFDWRDHKDVPVVLLAPASGGLFPETYEEESWP